MPIARRRGDLWLSLLPVAICVAIAAALAMGRAGVPPAHGEPGAVALNVASLMVDDGFYYLKIAENLAGGLGSSFDTLHSTNGYHPLWLLVVVPVYWLTGDRGGALLLTFVLQAGLMTMVALSLYRLARRGMATSSALAAVLIWLVIQCGYWPSLSGMEFALQSLLIVLLMHEGARLTARGSAGFADGLRLSLLIGLAFLARLDNVVLGLLLLLFLARAAPRSRRQVLAAAAALGSTVLAYGLLNLLWFGSILPVSGTLKREWSLELLARDPVYVEHGWLLAKLAYLRWPVTHWPGTESSLLALGTVGIGAALLVERFGWGPRFFGDPLSRALRPFALFALLQVSFYVVVYHGGYSFQPWYFAVQNLLAGLMAGGLVELARHRLQAPRWFRVPRRVVDLLVAGLLIALGARIGWSVEQKRQARIGFWDGPLFSAARWVDEQLPAATRVGAWNAGILAYFSDARIVNLDGLVNSTDYVERRHDLCRYWREEGIGYLADVFDRRDPFTLFGEQAGPCLDRLDLLWEGPTYPGSSYGSAVYRIAPDPSPGPP